MRRLCIFILTVWVASLMSRMTAQTEGWTIYASYHNATKAVKADTRIYVLASGDLLSYDTGDSSVETYDKTNALSDFGIWDIAYSATSKNIVVLYENGNIDLLSLNNHTRWNMPDLKMKILADKTLNELTVVGDEALISLNSGLALVNLQKGYFIDFYDLGSKVTNATIANGKIYAKTAAGVREGDRTKNLLELRNWTPVAANTVTFGPTAEEKTAAAALLEQVKDIVPNSPVRNSFYHLYMHGTRLLAAGGNFFYPNINISGTAMKYEGGKWMAFDDQEAISLVGENAYLNVTDVIQDPSDSEHHWLGTMRSGIYEFQNYKLVNHYTYDNSPITSILPEGSHPDWYTRVTALNFDPKGNLWMCNNECDTIVRILKKDRTWKSYYYEEVTRRPTWDHTYFDRRGWAWLVNRRTSPNGDSGILIINTNGTIDTQKDDQHRYISLFYNQNGENYAPDLYYCVTEDLNGDIWIGCTPGIFTTSRPTEVFSSDFTFTQPIVPRNDGSGLGDYLLNGISVKCIAIDGGNRKWVGTLGNGVYLLSADGMETIEHFTTENSPLIHNDINDIAINGETGEVFFATLKGLCSFRGDATDPATSMSSNNLKVFPNPVRPDYQGKVHITGLMYNSDVKIVSAAGKLVTEGTSVGGEYSWDCCYKNGRRVASGIYYALCTDESGKKGAVAKILIIK